MFQPYSGVKTSVLLFRQGGTTERVLFLHADADGYKLDAQHDTPIDEDDLPALVEAFRRREELWPVWRDRDLEAEWAEKWWFAQADAIRANDFNLSAGRYRPMTHAQAEHRDPMELLDELKTIEVEIMEELEALADTLRESIDKSEAAE